MTELSWSRQWEGVNPAWNRDPMLPPALPEEYVAFTLEDMPVGKTYFLPASEVFFDKTTKALVAAPSVKVDISDQEPSTLDNYVGLTRVMSAGDGRTALLADMRHVTRHLEPSEKLAGDALPSLEPSEGMTLPNWPLPPERPVRPPMISVVGYVCFDERGWVTFVGHPIWWEDLRALRQSVDNMKVLLSQQAQPGTVATSPQNKMPGPQQERGGEVRPPVDPEADIL